MKTKTNTPTANEPLQDRMERAVAESDIRNLAARFSDAVILDDPDSFGKLWGIDPIWEIGEPFANKAKGKTEIVALFRRLRPMWGFFAQLTHSGVIEFQSDRAASVRWTVREVARSSDGSQSYDNLGIYDDRLEWIEGAWKFASRSYHYIWLSDAPLVGRSFSLPAHLTSGTKK
jgi:hypothetical protein